MKIPKIASATHIPNQKYNSTSISIRDRNSILFLIQDIGKSKINQRLFYMANPETMFSFSSSSNTNKLYVYVFRVPFGYNSNLTKLYSVTIDCNGEYEIEIIGTED